MAINYAEKYAPQVDERFTKETITANAVNKDYDFTGVKTVKVYSVPTAPMNDYKRNGANRYGEPQELEDSVQELTMTRDRSFAFTIDKGNDEDQQNTKNAAKALARQISEVIVPEIDKYRLNVIADNAKNVVVAAVTKTTAYSAFLNGMEALTNELAPIGGRVAYVSANFYKLLKQDESFIKSGDLAQDMLIKGQVGAVDGVPIVLTPTQYFPEGVEFILTNAVACTSPIKLNEFKIHVDPPGINGNLVEGRVYYDAFVLNNKKGAIYVHRSKAAVQQVIAEDNETLS